MSKKSNSPSLGVRIGADIIHGASWLVGRLPHRFLYYPLADFIYFVLYRVVRYRLVVVRDNLSSSFPEKSTEELRTTERGFYHNLAEYFIDAVSIASITPRERMKRCPWPEENRARVVAQTDGRNWIALLAHYGSWELMSTYALSPEAPVVVSAYRPLSGKAFDLYYKRVRNFPPRIYSVPSNEILRFYMAHRQGMDGSPLSIALIADQYAHQDAQSRWIPFLGHPTVFFHGGEKIGRKFSLPVYYMRVRKLARGRWEQTFEMIWDGVSPTSDHEITTAYARLLEEDIRLHPELWLWSHRRWKRIPQGEEARVYNEKYGTNY
jgi:KDO2-lipid IV(A) lauroyltransferase